MAEFSDQLKRYQRLLREAADLENLGDKTSGGQTYWSNMKECTAAAICAKTRPPEGTTWNMSAEQMHAIFLASIQGPHLDALCEAASLKAALEKERAELEGVLSALENAPAEKSETP